MKDIFKQNDEQKDDKRDDPNEEEEEEPRRGEWFDDGAVNTDATPSKYLSRDDQSDEDEEFDTADDEPENNPIDQKRPRSKRRTKSRN